METLDGQFFKKLFGGGQGGYSGLAGTTRVFMVYDNVTINKQA
ncbi:Hypothetical protein ABZS17I87_00493 [Kosakonia cowanii]